MLKILGKTKYLMDTLQIDEYIYLKLLYYFIVLQAVQKNGDDGGVYCLVIVRSHFNLHHVFLKDVCQKIFI